MDAPRIGAAVLAALAVAGLAAALGSPLDPLGPAQAAADHHVHIQGFAMSPDPLEVAAGQSVEWHNHDGATHTASEGAPGDGRDSVWDTGSIPSGESVTVTFQDEATYEYYCKVHPGSMNGFGLVVGEPPTVSISSPSEGATVGGDVTVSGTADAPSSTLERVEVRIDDGDWREATGTTDWAFTWDTRDVTDGGHAIHARAHDGVLYSDVASVQVTVDNPRPDLAASDLRVQERTAGREAVLAVDVENTGAASSPADGVRFTYQAADGTREVGTPTLPSLAPGASATVTVTWDTRGQVGGFDVRALADPGGDVIEGDEANNAAATEVCFPETGGACQVPGVDPVGAAS